MIIVFDAHCLLCSGWVRFLLRRRGGQHIRFASVWRDAAYRWVATRRYRLFGRSEACMLPPDGSGHRFLD